MDNNRFSPSVFNVYRLTVSDCSLSRRQKPKLQHYDFSSVFDCIECFLATPKRFNPTITKLVDVTPQKSQSDLSSLFSDDDKYFDLSNIKLR